MTKTLIRANIVVPVLLAVILGHDIIAYSPVEWLCALGIVFMSKLHEFC